MKILEVSLTVFVAVIWSVVAVQLAALATLFR